MLGRNALKISFFVVASCTVILAFAIVGEMTLHWLRPSGGGGRLKLEIVADNGMQRPALHPADSAKPTAIPTPKPRPAAAPGPFDAVAPKVASTASPVPALSYAEPPPASANLPASPQSPPASPGAGGATPSGQGTAPGTSQSMASLEPPSTTDTPAATAPQDAAKPEDQPISVADQSQGARHASFKAAMNDPSGPDLPGQSLRVLQIGDSHTAADMFTGEVRQRLQALYGDGGAGYLVVGKPHPGVRSDIMKMTASSGWAYKAIQRADDSSDFHLSGFNAVSSKAGETLTLATDAPISFDSIDIEVKHGPDSGAVELRFDNDQAVKFDLAGPKPEWWFLRATSRRNRVEQLRQLAITTLDSRPVDISSVAIFNQSFGVSYSAIGFPGATVDIVNKFAEEFFTEDLQRIDPQIVVLAFGTNEGFNDALDVAAYGQRYLMAVNRIRAAVPKATIVLVGPSNANRLPHACRSDAAQLACKPRPPSDTSDSQACVWETPPKLDRVREMQKLIATQEHLYYWNWADVMPPDCGAHAWASASPRLMQPDHVHFTADGYRLGAAKFAEFLRPIIEKLRLHDRVVSYN